MDSSPSLTVTSTMDLPWRVRRLDTRVTSAKMAASSPIDRSLRVGPAGAVDVAPGVDGQQVKDVVDPEAGQGRRAFLTDVTKLSEGHAAQLAKPPAALLTHSRPK